MRVRLVGSTDVQALAKVTEQAFGRVAQVVWCDVTFPDPDAPFSIYHRVGLVPLGWIANAYGTVGDEGEMSLEVYATVNDRRQWDEARLVLRTRFRSLLAYLPSRFMIGVVF